MLYFAVLKFQLCLSTNANCDKQSNKNKNLRQVNGATIMKLLRHSLFIVVSLLMTNQALALSTDRDQPAEVEADDIEFDFQKGLRTYINNVSVVQGTLRIKADKVVTKYENDDLSLATAWGNLARFKQRPDGKQYDTEGWARKIIVDQKANTLTLLGKAAVKQGPNTARGETIVYNMANDTMRIKSGRVGDAGKDGETATPTKLEDGFRGSDQGPAPIPERQTQKKVKKATDAEDGDSSNEDTQEAGEEEAEEQVKPTRSGRSRLIIQPK